MPDHPFSPKKVRRTNGFMEPSKFWQHQKEHEAERQALVLKRMKKPVKKGKLPAKKEYTPRQESPQEKAIGDAYRFHLGERNVINEPILDNKMTPDYLINLRNRKFSIVEVMKNSDLESVSEKLDKYGKCTLRPSSGNSASLIIVPYASKIDEAKKAVEEYNERKQKEKEEAERNLKEINSRIENVLRQAVPPKDREKVENEVIRFLGEHAFKVKRIPKSMAEGMTQKLFDKEQKIFYNNKLLDELSALYEQRKAAQENIDNAHYHKAFIVSADSVRTVTRAVSLMKKDDIQGADGLAVADNINSKIKEQAQPVVFQKKKKRF